MFFAALEANTIHKVHGSAVQSISPSQHPYEMHAEFVVSNSLPSQVPNDIDEECLSEAMQDLVQTFKQRFPDIETQTIEQVVGKASEIFRDSHANRQNIVPTAKDTSDINPSKGLFALCPHELKVDGDTKSTIAESLGKKEETDGSSAKCRKLRGSNSGISAGQQHSRESGYWEGNE
jgi:hypothetical protein